ncbi:hypothetical protein SAMN05421676_101404 [Salinibacillus kushneri]|uniref:Uncharacterized protein n=1 Tax=Salinibacillus kushneri TaxID=237682 RepID=A0A1H9Z5Z0_9BACI|nr:hypothetical protein SAMN05421676_101404 [Salinibacillus kushneri]
MVSYTNKQFIDKIIIDLRGVALAVIVVITELRLSALLAT